MRRMIFFIPFVCYLVEDAKIKNKNQWMKTSKLTEPGTQTVSQNSFTKLWKQSAHPLSAPLIKTRMLTRMNWSQPNGIYVRSVGQLEAPDLNNLPKMPQ